MPPAPDAATLWARAVEAGAQGEYDVADSACARLAGRGGRWNSLAHSTRASHRRQIGATDQARDLDEHAFACADDGESLADALIGLAADAVASADSDAAATWHLRAVEPARGQWRTLTRWHWVGAELSLLLGDRESALEHADEAARSCADRSGRHHAKSLIIRSAVTGDIGALVPVASAIEIQGWRSLLWPLALVASEHPGTCDPEWLDRIRVRATEAIDHIDVHLPEDLTPVWRLHPGVRRLRADVAAYRGE